jgi:hypothetical protein
MILEVDWHCLSDDGFQVFFGRICERLEWKIGFVRPTSLSCPTLLFVTSDGDQL